MHHHKEKLVFVAVSFPKYIVPIKILFLFYTKRIGHSTWDYYKLCSSFE